MSQDSAAVAAPSQAAAKPSPHLPEPEQKLRCPRCDSTDTKFCYYNNYNLSQPRHFCKGCRRYWTKGGALRNVPVGGGTRKSSKRSSSSSSAAAPASKRSNPVKPATFPTEIPAPDPISVLYPPLDPDYRFQNVTGSFSSLLACTGHFNGLLNSFVSHGGAAFVVPNYSSSGSSSTVGVHGMELQSFTGSSSVENMAPPSSNDNLLGLHTEHEYWTGPWSDLSIYNPGSDLQ